MENVDLNKIPVQETEGHTSKGNQLKWKLGDQWYKADHIQIHFHFGVNMVQEELKMLKEGYAEEVIMRVERLLREQMRRYAYLMD